MSDSAERKEQATPHKLQKARERGEISYSRQLAALAGILGCMVIAPLIAQYLLEGIGEIARVCFEPRELALHPSDLPLVAGWLLSKISISVLVLLVVPTLLSCLAVFLQIGPIWSLEPLKPKIERLNPVEGIKKRLFSIRTFFDMCRGIIATFAILGCVWLVATAWIGPIVLSGQSALDSSIELLKTVLVGFSWRAIMCLAVLSCLDVLHQKWQYARDQRMTRQEQKQEHKDDEGDPHVKHARQRQYEEIVTNQMLEEVREKADVVVKNPTHLACALYYDPGEGGSPPKVIGKGKGWVAERIRQIAKDEGIPEVRNVPLARALFKLELDERIPRHLYEAVVETLHLAEEIAESRGQQVRWKARMESDDVV